MTKLERDHPRLREVRDRPPGDPPPLVQYQCGMCGTFFLLKASLERHKAGEIPAFVTWAAAKREAWEQGRERWREIAPFIAKEDCE